MEPQEKDFEFPRGDTCPISFSLVDSDKKPIDVGQNDEIYFTMKKSYSTREYLLQKKYSTGDIQKEDNQYKLILMPDDTNKMNYGTYVFDLCIKSGDLTRTVCIGQITLTNEATFIYNE